MSMTHKPILTDSITAAANLAARRFIDFDGNLANDEAALGVSEVSVSTGQQCPVIAVGIALVETGGDVTKGSLVKADTTGRAINLGAAGTPLGRSLDAATGAGKFVRVLVGAFAPVVA